MKAASDYGHVSTNVEIESSHWVQQDKPDKTNRIKLDWLRRHFPL